jgi:hypothetical protein
LYWVKTNDGEFNKGGQRKKANSRILVVKVHLTKGAGVLGTYVVVMLVHFHNKTAKKHLTVDAYEKFWRFLLDAIVVHSVDILMGDFNMSLLCVVPRLRQRGIIVDLGSWFPNTSGNGDCPTHLDSMGIFLIGGTRGVTLRQGLSSLDNMFPNGRENYGRGRGVETVAEIVPGARPTLGGYPLRSYVGQPNPVESLRATLTPSPDALVVRVGASEPFERGRHNRWPGVSEKRLDSSCWDPDMTALGHGAHFPLFVVTRGVGRRSNGRLDARYNKWKDPRGDFWHGYLQDHSRNGDAWQGYSRQGLVVTSILII